MTKKFLALAKANIEEQINIHDNFIKCLIDPVYTNGLKFSGEVLVSGIIKEDTDEKTLSAILQDYLREHTDFARISKIEFREEKEREKNTYRRSA